MSERATSDRRGRRAAVWAGVGAIVLAAALLAPGAYESWRYPVIWRYLEDGRSVQRKRIDRRDQRIIEDDAWFIATGMRRWFVRMSEAGGGIGIHWREDGELGLTTIMGSRGTTVSSGYGAPVDSQRDAPWLESGFDEWRKSVGLGPPPRGLGSGPSEFREP